MNFTVKATNTTLTPTIEEYIGKKIAQFDKIIPGEDTSAHMSVEIGKETEHHKTGDVFFAELNLHIAGKDFRTRRNGQDMYAALDIAKDELLDTVRGYKNKKTTLYRRGKLMVKDMMRGFNWKRKK